MMKKTKKVWSRLYVHRSYEPLKMTIAISAAAGVLIVWLGLMTLGVKV